MKLGKFVRRRRVLEGKAKKPETGNTPFVILMKMETCFWAIKEAQKSLLLTDSRGLQHSFTMLFKQEAQGNPCLCTLSLAATTTGSGSSKSIQHHGTTNPAQKAKPDDAGIICSGCHYFFHSVASKQTSEKSNTPRRATWETSIWGGREAGPLHLLLFQQQWLKLVSKPTGKWWH